MEPEMTGELIETYRLKRRQIQAKIRTREARVKVIEKEIKDLIVRLGLVNSQIRDAENGNGQGSVPASD